MNNVNTPATTPATTAKNVNFPRPLVVAADMRPRWVRNLETFDAAADAMMAAHREDGATSDVPFSDLRQYAVVPVSTDNPGTPQRLALAPIGRHREPTPMRRLAFTSLCQDLKVPVEYMRDRLPAPIQLAAMNYHLATYGRSQAGTMRMRGSELAALVGPKYAVLDHADMLDEIRNALAGSDMLGGALVRAVATGTTDVLRIAFPTMQRELKKGDVTQVCLDISNSVFGTRALYIQGGVYRLACTNGMQSWEVTNTNRIIHTGSSDKLRNGIREAIPLALAQARGLMDAFAQSVSVMVDSVWEQIAQLRDLTTDEQLRVRDAVAVEAGAPALPEHVDLFTYVNGITRAAHQATPERRLDMEALAGRVLRDRL